MHTYTINIHYNVQVIYRNTHIYIYICVCIAGLGQGVAWCTVDFHKGKVEHLKVSVLNTLSLVSTLKRHLKAQSPRVWPVFPYLP